VVQLFMVEHLVISSSDCVTDHESCVGEGGREGELRIGTGMKEKYCAQHHDISARFTHI
jgi:hypothetical protein